MEQVAERLGLHVKTVRGYVREGRLKAVRIGKQYRISRQDLEALTGVLNRRPSQSRAPVTSKFRASWRSTPSAPRRQTASRLRSWARAQGIRIEAIYNLNAGT